MKKLGSCALTDKYLDTSYLVMLTAGPKKDKDVCWSVHLFGPEWSNYGTNINFPLYKNPMDFVSPSPFLRFHQQVDIFGF